MAIYLILFDMLKYVKIGKIFYFLFLFLIFSYMIFSFALQE